MPFQKGNPWAWKKGQRPPGAGRPKGAKNKPSIVAIVQEYLHRPYIQLLHDYARLKGYKGEGRPPKFTTARVKAIEFLIDRKMFPILLDRLYGKVPSELTGAGGVPLVVEFIKAEKPDAQNPNSPAAEAGRVSQ